MTSASPFFSRVIIFLGFGSVLELVLELGLVLQLGIGLFAGKKFGKWKLVLTSNLK